MDYTSMESLANGLRGIDALVSTVGHAALDSQAILIDAAILAGVKRFIPSEFGSVTTNPKVKDLPPYIPMFRIKEYLHKKATTGELTWTVLACGAFLEFVFGYPIVLDFTNHKATLFDEGDNKFSSTSLVNIGKAIVGIFNNSEATKNRVVRVSEVILTQNKMLKVADSLRPDIKWELSKIKASALLKEGLDGLSAGDFSMPVALKVIGGTAFAGDVYGGYYEETDNALLGVTELTDENVKNLIFEKLV